MVLRGVNKEGGVRWSVYKARNRGIIAVPSKLRPDVRYFIWMLATYLVLDYYADEHVLFLLSS